MRRTTTFGATFGLMALAGAALAHHGDAGRFEDEVSTISGTVVALQLINPHSGILLSVPDANGSSVTWHVEMEAPQRLQSEFGWNRSTLTPGMKITVTGRRIKSGAPNINVTERARILLTDSCEELYHSRDMEPLAEKPASCQ
ncbi:MAG TPA: DUF6152 family protein [Gammaproteobacteria bacterium]|nr:DUF6152 family protein [Gammaproteobacteria bacterium]